jgi:hypothetical protein
MAEFDSAVLDIISSNPRDVPFAALYHVDTKVKSETKPTTAAKLEQSTASTSASTKCQLTLASTVGVPDNHPSTPQSLNITLVQKSRGALSHITGSPTMSVISSLSGGQVKRTQTPSEDGLKLNLDAWPFREALQTKRIVLVEDCAALIEGYPVRIWDELPDAAVVVPIANDSDESVPSAVIVIGLSIRRPFDEDYEQFLVSPAGVGADDSMCFVCSSRRGSRRCGRTRQRGSGSKSLRRWTGPRACCSRMSRMS